MRPVALAILVAFFLLLAYCDKYQTTPPPPPRVSTTSANRTSTTQTVQITLPSVSSPIIQIAPNEDIMKRFYLVRSHDFLDGSCRSQIAASDAILILPPGTSDGEMPADDFFVLLSQNADLKGTLTKMLNNCEYEFNVDNAKFGILHLAASDATSLKRSGNYLALRGGVPDEQMRGRMLRLERDEFPRYQTALRKLIDAKEDFGVRSAYKIILPGSATEITYLSVEHFEKNAMITLGDKAVMFTGFLFDANGHLIFADDGLLNILEVTDLNKDGIYELLVHHGGNYTGAYEMRLFDGKKLSESKRVLYRWMD